MKKSRHVFVSGGTGYMGRWVIPRSSPAATARGPSRAKAPPREARTDGGHAGGSSGFHNPKLDSIPLNLPTAVGIAPGDTLSIKLLVRNACSGGGENSVTARLWFNDTEADSHFDATIDAQEEDDYLLDGAALGSSPGPGPKKAIDVSAGARCSDFKPFGTWTRTLN